MAWRSSLWARWLGWTALYALVLLGALVFAVRLVNYFYPSDSNYPEWLTTFAWVLGVLVPTVLPFGIGLRFRSWWWGLGPLAAFSVPAAAIAVAVWIGDIYGDYGAYLLLLAIMLPIFGGLLSLVALAGVWWGKRRHASTFRPLRVGPGGDAATEQLR